MVKSGTDFRNYSIVMLAFQENGQVDVQIEKQTISASIPENEDVKKIVSDFAGYIPYITQESIFLNSSLGAKVSWAP